jgi:LmbE family N-acetylglucosaminyl deacetylase
MKPLESMQRGAVLGVLVALASVMACGEVSVPALDGPTGEPPDGPVVDSPDGPDVTDGADGSTDADVPDPPLGPWGVPVPLPRNGLLNTTADEDAPSLRGDGLELYFASSRVANDIDIYVTTRASLTSPWSDPRRATFNSVGHLDTTPALSRDGLNVWFASSRGGNIDVWFASRASTSPGSPWSDPIRISSLSSSNFDFPNHVTSDGKTLTLTSNRGGTLDVFLASRASPTADWATVVPLDELNTNDRTERDITISDDLLHVIFRRDDSGMGDFFEASRTTPADPFGNIEPVGELNSLAEEGHPSVSPDERIMIFDSRRDGANADLFESRRVEALAPAAGDLFVVAHQDDDLLFMNPRIAERVRAGAPVAVAYLTAGDAGEGIAMLERRETGIRAAYAYMAAVPDVWTEEDVFFAGRPVRRLRLATTNVSLYFFRLPDGNLAGDGFGQGSLWQLYTGQRPTLALIHMPDVTYDLSTLSNALRDLIVLVNPQELHTLEDSDTTLTSADLGFSTDHSDHVSTGRLILQAAMSVDVVPRISVYRGYTLTAEPSTLSPEVTADKIEVFRRFARFYMCNAATDVEACLNELGVGTSFYGPWFSRMYSRSGVVRSGRLETADSQCVRAGTNGGVTTGPCDSAAQWVVDSAMLVHDSQGRCLDFHLQTEAVGMTPCGTKRWLVFDEGQVRGRDGRCLQTQPTGQIVVSACHPAPEQTFRFSE